jgi:hypothetical protein
MNGTSAWDEDLSDLIVDRVVAPVVEHLGAPTRGFDVYIFGGRYRWTPFGIHSDSEDSILVHLGPAEKTAFVWNRDAYLNATACLKGRFNNFDVEPLISIAEEYRLLPGDLLCIPRGHFHVMTSPEFSVTMGVIPNPATRGRLVSLLLRDVLEDIEGASEDCSFISESAALTNLYEWVAALGLRNPSLQSGVADALTASALRLRSNGYLVPSPVTPAAIPDENLLLQVPHRYPMCAKSSEDQMTLFVRGFDIGLKDSIAIRRALERMNNGGPFTLGEISTILAQEFSDDACTAITRQLNRLGAFRRDQSFDI